MQRRVNVYRFPPTRGAAFICCLGAFWAAFADLALGAAAAAGFFVVALAVFFNSFAALKRVFYLHNNYVLKCVM